MGYGLAGGPQNGLNALMRELLVICYPGRIKVFPVVDRGKK
jgi:hypothetical protein